jgi:hypothetical protein
MNMDTNLDSDAAAITPTILSVLETLYTDRWSGVLRIRSGAKIGAVWLIKGQVVHCLQIEGKQRRDGISALEDLLHWPQVAYILEADVLPPARSIRLPMAEIMSALLRRTQPESQRDEVLPRTAVPQVNLDEIYESLRLRVPGLEAISVMNGVELERTTLRDTANQNWLDRQLQMHLFNPSHDPEKLYLQDDDHALLIMKHGHLSAVLMARNGTAPEALFWAGEEARKRIKQVG